MSVDIRRIPSPCDNPSIAPLRFLSEEDRAGPPWLGTYLAEVFAMTWWRSPCVNMHPHWMARSAVRPLLERPARFEDYLRRAHPKLWAGAYLTGTYRFGQGEVRVRASVYRVTEGETGERTVSEVEGWEDAAPVRDLRDRMEWGARCLLDRWFPEGREHFREEASLIDCSETVFRRLCAAFDAEAHRNQDLRNALAWEARAENDESAYAEFMAAMVRRDEPCGLGLYRRVLSRHPDFVPACFSGHRDWCPEGQWPEMLRFFRRGLDLAPLNTALFEAARALLIELNDDETLLALCRMHAARGSYGDAGSRIGGVFALAAEDARSLDRADLALRLCEEGLRLAEDAQDVNRLLVQQGLAQEAVGLVNGARESLRRALAKYPCTLHLVEYTAFLLRRGEWVRAEKNLRWVRHGRGVMSRSERWRLLRMLAEALEGQGRHAEAQRLLRRLAALPVRDGEDYANAVRTWELVDGEGNG